MLTFLFSHSFSLLIFCSFLLSLVFLSLSLSHFFPRSPLHSFAEYILHSSSSLSSHDTRKFTFALQTPTTVLGLPIGQHIAFTYTDPTSNKAVTRSYTPVTGDETLGVVSFVIKVYFANTNERFPEGGKMTQHLESLKVGDSLLMRGPKGKMTYMSKGKFGIAAGGVPRKPAQVRQAKHFGMIAGGTGITPMLQVIDAVMRDTNDTTTTMSLLFANQTEEDILCRDMLEAIEKKSNGRLKLWYTLDRPPAEGWKYSKAFVTEEMIRDHVLAGGDLNLKDTQILMCGPPPMLKFACKPALTNIGLAEDNWFEF